MARPLRRGHRFDHPVAVEEDDGTVRLHWWPQGAYLQRVAGALGAEVAEVIAGLERWV